MITVTATVTTGSTGHTVSLMVSATHVTLLVTHVRVEPSVVVNTVSVVTHDIIPHIVHG